MKKLLALLALVCAPALAQNFTKSTCTHGEVCQTQNPDSTDLFWNMRRIGQFDILLNITQASAEKPTLVMLHFHADTQHRNLITRMSDYSFIAGVRGPVSDANTFPTDPHTPYPTWVKGAVSGANILQYVVTPSGSSDFHKYGQASFQGAIKLISNGWYRLEIWAKARSSAAQQVSGQSCYVCPIASACPGCDGLVEVLYEGNDMPLNNFLVEVR